jgi:glycosyltransferase involved in cell wall biosynthesis
MRVLTVVSDLGIGGTQRVAQNYTLGLRDSGVETAVLTYRGDGPRSSALSERNIPLFITNERTELSDALRYAKGWSPDIVHIHRPGYSNRIESDILSFFRANVHGIVETNVFGRYDRSIPDGLVDVHCLISQWCSFKWHAWGGVGARKKYAVVIPNSVEPNTIRRFSELEREASRAALSIPSGRFVFGRVGQPIASKWSVKIFESFATILKDGHDVGLLLIGAPDALKHHALRLPASQRERIICLPPTNDDHTLAAYFNSMDAFLHLSDIGESFGMVLCEAMQAGIPVITHSTPLKDNSQLEVVGHELGGLIALDLDSVPKAMIRLMGDRQLREAVRLNGARWVNDRYGPGVVTKQLTTIYDKLLAKTLHITPSNTAHVSAPPTRAWINSMLATGIGRAPTLRARIAFEVVHNPLAYNSYLSLRGML